MDILFFTFIAIFIATAIITLLGVAEKINIKSPALLKLLVTALIIESAAAVIGVYKQADFFEQSSNAVSSSISNTVEDFDKLADQIKDVINQTDDSRIPHSHSILIRQSGPDLIAYQKMQTITGNQLSRLPEKQRKMIKAYESSMNALKEKWFELWPKRINPTTGKIDKNVNDQLLTLVKGMRHDLIGIFNFLQAQGIFLDDHYMDIRHLISGL